MDSATIAQILPKLSSMPIADQVELLKLLEGLEDAKGKERAQSNFLPFVKRMWPGFIEGPHHGIMADTFDRVISGECKRVIINMAPRHTKSEFASYLLPAYFMGKYPEKKIIQATHTAELAVDFGRKVRNLIKDEAFSDVFPGVGLRADSTASGRWNTTSNGAYFAVGVGGAIAGKGADLFIIDDPHSEQEAIQAAHDPKVFEKVYEWYSSGPRQRLQPNAAIVVVMCMTGDTPVLMASGEEKLLKNIRPGDNVATYENGVVSTAKIKNWQSSGVDSIFTVRTKSGKTVRANKRHPFLVDFNGEREWVKLENLKAGFSLVGLMDAQGPQGHKPGQEHAPPAKQKNLTTEKTPTLCAFQLGGMECGAGNCVNVESQCRPRDYALIAIEKNTVAQSHQNRQGMPDLNTYMVLPLKNMRKWFWSVKTYVTCAANLLPKKIRALIGMENSALTTAMTQEKFVDCCAITATSQLDMEKTQKYLNGPLDTYAVILDEIVSIDPAGEEEVFDVEVDRTENFIANGLVSHNTRWGVGDLTGRLVQASIDRGDGDQWEVIELPAILPSGEPMWPAFWSKPALEALKSELPAAKWNAQYQQKPTSEEGAILKREWWRRWDKKRMPQCEYIIIASDTAFTKNNRSDYSAFTVWGVFENEGEGGSNIIMLDAWKDRLEFPDLKAKAIELYKEWEPDTFLIEAKASGLPLIHELRKAGVMVSEFTPTRASGDKVMRANSISDIFASGVVWAPTGNWANEVIEECASFPVGAHDDYVDTVIMALMRYRQGGLLRLPSDDEDDYTPQTRAEYY